MGERGRRKKNSARRNEGRKARRGPPFPCIMKIPRDNLDKRFGADEPTSTCGRWNLARGMSDEEGGRVGKGVMGVGFSQCLSLIGAKGPKYMCG